MSARKLVIIAIGAVILGCIVGYVWGLLNIIASYSAKPTGTAGTVGTNGVPPMQTVILSVNGLVEKINGSVVTIDLSQVAQGPFLTGTFPETREVTVTDATEISQVEEKDPAVYQKESANYQKEKQGSGAAASGPPVPSESVDIKLSDLKMGEEIIATADEDIKDAQSFTATRIQVIPVILKASSSVPVAAPASLYSPE